MRLNVACSWPSSSRERSSSGSVTPATVCVRSPAATASRPAVRSHQVVLVEAAQAIAEPGDPRQQVAREQDRDPDRERDRDGGRGDGDLGRAALCRVEAAGGDGRIGLGSLQVGHAGLHEPRVRRGRRAEREPGRRGRVAALHRHPDERVGVHVCGVLRRDRLRVREVGRIDRDGLQVRQLLSEGGGRAQERGPARALVEHIGLLAPDQVGRRVGDLVAGLRLRRGHVHDVVGGGRHPALHHDHGADEQHDHGHDRAEPGEELQAQ